MKFRNQHAKFGPRFAPLYFKDGDGGDSGGGAAGDSGGEGALTPEQVQARIDAEVAGLKSKNDELLDALNKTKQQLKPWDGLDPEKVRGLMSKMEKDEELRLLAEGKTDEAFQRRLERVNAQHQSTVDTLSQERDQFKAQAEQFENQVRDLIIDQQVISSFMQEKGIESAAPDVVNRAKAAFTIEDGQPIARDEKGQIIRGKDGPISIQEWVAKLKETAPHLFPPSRGAGARGSSGGSLSSLDARMQAAAEANDMAEYRRLRKERDSAA